MPLTAARGRLGCALIGSLALAGALPAASVRAQPARGVQGAPQGAPTIAGEWRALEHVTYVRVDGLVRRYPGVNDPDWDQIQFYPRQRQVALVAASALCRIGTEMSRLSYLVPLGGSGSDTVACADLPKQFEFRFQARASFTGSVLTIDGTGDLWTSEAGERSLNKTEAHVAIAITPPRCRVLTWRSTEYTANSSRPWPIEVTTTPSTTCSMMLDNGMYYGADGSTVNMRE